MAVVDEPVDEVGRDGGDREAVRVRGRKEEKGRGGCV